MLLGYQIFLGRDPENSFVIADAKANSLRGFLHGLVTSAECQGAVMTPLLTTRKLPHERSSPGPTEEHIAWLLGLYDAPDAFAEAVRGAATWRELWRVLAALPDVPGDQAEAIAAAPVTPAVTALDPDAGFVLISIDQPKPDETLHPGAILTGNGWIIAPSDIVQVSVYLDEILLTHARHGLPRPDVARNFPHYRQVDHCGFAFTATLPADLGTLSRHVLRIAVATADGQTGEKTLAITVAEKSAAKPGDAWPIRLAIEDARVDAAGTLALRGWAVSRENLASLTIFLGDRLLGQAERGPATPGIARTLPDYPDLDQAGFTFGASLAGHAPGPASVRVQATDQAGRQRQAIAPVVVPDTRTGRRGRAAQGEAMVAAAEPVRLEIDSPLIDGDVALAPPGGALTISGWAVAQSGVTSVQIRSDQGPLGSAYLGMRREDIGRAFPGYENALLSGFAMVLPPGALPEGTRRVTVTARSKDGGEAEQSFSLPVQAPDPNRQGSTIRYEVPRAEAAYYLNLLAQRQSRPRFHIVIRAASMEAAAATLRSLERQAYPEWTALLVLPAGTPVTEARERAGGLRRAADRLTVCTAEAVPEAPAGTSLIGAIHAGDELGADALLQLASAHAMHKRSGLIYADEQRIDRHDGHYHPFFKPDWSPELLLGMNYIGRPWCATPDVLAAAGLGLAALATGSEYDAVLRVTEKAAEITHVDRLLLRRGDSPPDGQESERAALMSMAKRRKIAGKIVSAAPSLWRVQRVLREPGRVSIIMPTCGKRGLVRAAIDSIRATTPGREVEIVILDNVPARDRKLKSWLRARADIVVDMPGGFNWSRFNNRGAALATGATLLFLNDDIEAPAPGWLDALLEHTETPGVGVVGARLLYPDGKIQHAGQYLADTHARHAFRFAQRNDPGPFGLALVAREMMSVTGACLAVRREVFDRLGGFEEAHSVINNDLDFCLRARQAGLSVLYTPHATLTHHELASRADLEDVFDEARFVGAWRGVFLRGDPYHSARLLAGSDHYAPDPEQVSEIHVGPAGPAAADIAAILAVKLDHIGDFLTALPALRRLKGLFPNARLYLLAPPATAVLAAGEACIDEVIEFTFFHAVSGRGQLGVSAETLEALRARLERYRFDMAIDLRMQPETRDVLTYTAAPFLCGYDHQGRFPFLHVALDWEGDISLVPKRQHISERLLQLVAAVGEACRAIAAPLPGPAASPASVPALAALPAGFLEKPLVCVHPGVGNAVRQWPAAHYASLVDLLTQECGLHAVLIGGGDEAPIAEEILRLLTARHAAESLAGRVKLDSLGAVMQASVLFVGNNSGPKHLAAALGVPTLGIHSAVVDAVEWGPLGAASFALRRDMVCGPCYLEFASDCPRGMACLTGITPRQAYAACLRLMAMRPDT